MNCKLLAFDLDGTLLRNDKSVSHETIAALKAAHEAGILIVPTTGRIYSGLPEQVAELPFLDYCIFGNGAGVYDVQNSRVISSIPLEAEKVLKIIKRFHPPEAIYGVYQNNEGFMPAAMRDMLEDYLIGDFFPVYLRKMYQPVPSLEEHFEQDGANIQKFNVYFRNEELKKAALEKMPGLFPDCAATTSLPTLIEFTNKDAHKGGALKLLCREIGIDIADTIAFGDGGNDFTLIREAGLGVAMENALPELKKIADYITLTNEEHGVAHVINAVLNGQM